MKKAKSREKKLERYVASEERVEKPQRSWQMKLELGDAPHLGKDVLMLDNLAGGYPGYKSLLAGLNLQVQAGQRVAITGPNGAGKTTLLRPIARLSFGERARLSLAKLVASGCNLLLLDEPINHLDIPSRGRFEQALTQFEGAILAVVHDRYFIQQFATAVWQVAERTIRHQLL